MKPASLSKSELSCVCCLIVVGVCWLPLVVGGVVPIYGPTFAACRFATGVESGRIVPVFPPNGSLSHCDVELYVHTYMTLISSSLLLLATC